MMNSVPIDRWNIIYVIFYCMGTGSLLPWHFLYSVDAYWKYKFRNVSVPIEHDTELTELQVQWAANLSIASMYPKVAFLIFNAIIGHKLNSNALILTSYIISIALFIFCDVMTQINTDAWQFEFFVTTMTSVVILNSMMAINQGGLFGLAGKFPFSYTGAVVQGQGLGGTFATAINVIILTFGINKVDAAFYNFLCVVVFLMITLVAFVGMTQSKFYHFYAIDSDSSNQLNEDQPLIQTSKSSLSSVTRQIWIWALAILINFMATLCVFPALTVLAKSTNSGRNEWNDVYFIPVGCFLAFNAGDFVGRTLAGLIKRPKASKLGSVFVLVMALLRLGFIPAFLFCNIAPQQRVITQVYFKSDIAYLSLMALFSISNGYIGSIILMFGPKTLSNRQDQGQAASILVLCLSVGLAVGAALSDFILKLL